jgi:hypothetical protein
VNEPAAKGFLPQGEMAELAVTQGVHPDEACVSHEVMNLVRGGDITAQFSYSIGVIASRVREITEWHDECCTGYCRICEALYHAAWVIFIYDAGCTGVSDGPWVLGAAANCVREIAEWHDGCSTRSCGICVALSGATSVIHAFDIVNSTAMWSSGTRHRRQWEGDGR